jgi:hypothetical protein
MSAPMVRALLDGRKKMTRRLAWQDKVDRRTKEHRPRPTPWQQVRPGDRLWVRETWMEAIDAGDWRYAANYDAAGVARMCELQPWRSPIHCARTASRLTLIVTATKIERLTDISERDCFAEGVEGKLLDEDTGKVSDFGPCALMNFGRLWETLHGNGSWLSNPEVVALTFAVHRQNIDAMPRQRDPSNGGTGAMITEELDQDRPILPRRAAMSMISASSAASPPTARGPATQENDHADT